MPSNDRRHKSILWLESDVSIMFDEKYHMYLSYFEPNYTFAEYITFDYPKYDPLIVLKVWKIIWICRKNEFVLQFVYV